MNLESILPPPPPLECVNLEHNVPGYSADTVHAHALAAARAGAVAALDEAIKQIDDDQILRPDNDEEEAYNEAHVGAVTLIRRLRDTIREGE